MKILKSGNQVYKVGNKVFTAYKEKSLSLPLLNGEGNLSNPQSAAVDRESGRIFVVNTGVDSLTILDYTNPEVMLQHIIYAAGQFTNPYGIAIDREGGVIYVATNSTGVAMLDYDDPAIYLGQLVEPDNTQSTDGTASIAHDIDNSAAIAIDYEGKRIFVGQGDGNTVVFDYETKNFIQYITGHGYPRGIIIDKPKNRVFIGQQKFNKVYIYTYDTLEKTGEFDISSPFGLTWDKSYNEIYIGSVGGNFVNIYDYSTLALKRTITQAQGQLSSPRFMTIDNYSNRIFIPNSGTHNISMFK